MKKILTVFAFSVSLCTYGQFNYELDQSINVSRDGKSLASPWAGGLNAAQYNTMDLDADGKDDLVLFDRMGQKVITYLNVGNTWKYHPEYEALFPTELTNWLLLRDFNGDGRKDIFTGDILGIRVFINVTDDEIPQWELFPFYTNNIKSEVLLTKGLSGMINLQMQFDDIPGIADADGDGDLDIFSIDFGGSGTVNFHRNYSVERFNHNDSLVFELVDKAWGDFRECNCGEFAFNNDDCISGGRVKHAGGKSLLVFDENNDGNPDVLISEGECSNLSLLRNEGTIENPAFNEAVPYPSTPANFSQYPTGYFEDVDFDGVKDLVAAPAIYAKEDVFTNLQESNWFYRNNGTNTAPSLVLVQKDFLQEDMIDVGDNSVPAAADLEGDGDLDLFISNNSFPARITLLNNIGSLSQPQFTVQDDDYLDLSERQFRNLKMQFTDLNKDGRADLVFTAIPVTGNTLQVLVMYNSSQTGLAFDPANIQFVGFTVSGSENILFTDVNSDGEPDIIKGRNNGAVEYWKNNGGLTFVLETGQFLGLGANIFAVNPSFAVSDLNLDGKADLIIGTSAGLQIYSDYRNFKPGGEAVSRIIYNPVLDEYQALNLGGRAWPVAAQLFEGSPPVIISGTALGGLKFLRPAGTTGDSAYVNVYPNPVRPGLGEFLRIIASSSGTLDIFTATGAAVHSGIPVTALETNTFDPGALASGLYLFRFSSGNKTLLQRIVVH